jgi:hypothetical protein
MVIAQDEQLRQGREKIQENWPQPVPNKYVEKKKKK